MIEVLVLGLHFPEVHANRSDWTYQFYCKGVLVTLLTCTCQLNRVNGQHNTTQGHHSWYKINFSIVVFGLAAVTFAGAILNFKYLLGGYGLVGFGVESSYIALDLILFKYFTYFELSFAAGMVEVLPLCAEYSGASISPFLYSKFGFAAAFGLGFLICVICYVLMIVLFVVDTRVEKHDKQFLKRFKERSFIDVNIVDEDENSEAF